MACQLKYLIKQYKATKKAACQYSVALLLFPLQIQQCILLIFSNNLRSHFWLLVHNNKALSSFYRWFLLNLWTPENRYILSFDFYLLVLGVAFSRVRNREITFLIFFQFHFEKALSKNIFIRFLLFYKWDVEKSFWKVEISFVKCVVWFFRN